MNSETRNQAGGTWSPTRILQGLTCCCALACTAAGAPATSGTRVPQTGLHYYVVQNRSTGQVIQRGTTGSAGAAFDRLILAPNASYRIWILQASTLFTGYIDVHSPGNGQVLRMPSILLGTDLSPDQDSDDLRDDGEFIMGTDPDRRDTDGDGVSDGAEVTQGTDPLSGLAVRTGIIGRAESTGFAVDIATQNDLAVVADSAGVSVFNIFNGMSPTRIAQVYMRDLVTAVACDGNLIVAVGASALGVIDISDPAAAVTVIQQVTLPGRALAVAASAGVAYVGLDAGGILGVDLVTGATLERLSVFDSVQDVAISGDVLYALTSRDLLTIALDTAPMRVVNTTESPGQIGVGGWRKRLFVGTDFLFATYTSGYNVFGLSDPLRPRQLLHTTTPQFGWKQIVANGSGSAVAVVGSNSTQDGPHDISLYQVGGEAIDNRFLTTYETPGLASAVALYNGLAYVADGLAGVEVMNYQAYDALGHPPAISLNFPRSPAEIEEGQPTRVSARVVDDVQVRNVEFYLDDRKVATDGNFPFEHRFIAPSLSGQKRFFTLRARASDTGGNAAWSDELMVTLQPDRTPPQVLRVDPSNDSVFGIFTRISLSAYFSEPINPGTLDRDSFHLVFAGPDDAFGTADDQSATNVQVSVRSNLRAGFLTISDAELAPGRYRATLSPRVADLANNPLTNEVQWTFRVVVSTVSNTNDSGPGSLREAIFETYARAGKDKIVFNIPGNGPHSIHLATALPTFFDSIILDGTTQPGYSGEPIIEIDGANAGQNMDGLMLFAGESIVRGLVINRCGGNGISVFSSGGVIIEGNYIGTDVAGRAKLGNGGSGVLIVGAPNNLIGGTSPARRNVISGNALDGIRIVSAAATENHIEGNYIGTDVTGTKDLGNGAYGVRIGFEPGGGASLRRHSMKLQAHNLPAHGASALIGAEDGSMSCVSPVGGSANNTIGGMAPGAGNLISANARSGVAIIGERSTGNQVLGNVVGSDISGTRPLPNLADGISLVNCSNNIIGGASIGAANLIAFNGRSGISVQSGSGHTARQNAIFSNHDLGLDLDADGITENDAGDGDGGSNLLQNYPVLVSVVKTRLETIIEGRLSSTPNATFTLEFFSNGTCDPSGNGEGERWLSSTTVSTEVNGSSGFTVRLPPRIVVGRYLTATAIDSSGNTSEFSPCALVTVQP